MIIFLDSRLGMLVFKYIQELDRPKNDLRSNSVPGFGNFWMTFTFLTPAPAPNLANLKSMYS